MSDIIKLAAELERQKNTRLDLVVDSRQIEAVPSGDDLNLSFPLGDNEMGIFPATNWAHSQIADKTGIPKKYYDKMREGHPDLLAKNINEWMPEKERRLVRVLDGSVRALLSDRYRIMDNHDLLFQALEEFKDMGVQVHRADLTETNMYIKAIVPHTTAEITEGDTVVPGLILRNSEVGGGAFRVEPFMLRLVCTNGLIGESVIQKIHLGKRQDFGLVQWSSETIMAESQTLWLQVRDTIRSTFDPGVFDKWVNILRNAANTPIEKPTLAITNIIGNYGISETHKDDLLDYFAGEDGQNQWTLANAFTRLAQDNENIDQQIELEEIGGQIAAMEAPTLLALVSKGGK